MLCVCLVCVWITQVTTLIMYMCHVISAKDREKFIGMFYLNLKYFPV